MKKDGAYLIAVERARQIGLGYGEKHDDSHDDGSLLEFSARIIIEQLGVPFPETRTNWTIHCASRVANKHPPGVRRLMIAGALIAAEIDRLQRAERQE